MDRSQVIQAILSRKRNPTYLEIGVFKGKVFLPLRAGRKIAVDPAFQIRTSRKLLSLLTNPGNRRSRYFEMTSDDFFARHSDEIAEGIDVAFVDGLHTYEQSHRDVENCLKFLKPGGVIVMHDCDPPSERAADPHRLSVIKTRNGEHPVEDRIWTGDVFKSLIRLRAEHNDLHIFVLDCDFGLGIISRGKPDSTVDLPVKEIKNLTFEKFAKQRQQLLNLKPVSAFDGWLKRVA